MMASTDLFDAYFRKADADQDGKVSGQEAVAFFQGSGLPNDVLAKIWQYADRGQTGSLLRPEFYNALKLVTVAQTGRQLTPDIVRAALIGPASSQIPAPRIAPLNLPQPQLYRPPTPTSLPSGAPQQVYPHGPATNHLSRPPIPPGPGSQRSLPVSGVSSSIVKPSVSGLATAPPSSSVLQSKSNSLPPPQTPKDAFSGSTFQAGGDSNGAKVIPSAALAASVDSVFGGDVFTATPLKATSAISSESKPVIPSETAQGLPDPGSRALVPTSLPPVSTSKQLQPVTQQSIPVSIHGQSLGIVASTGVAATGQWPKMTNSDVQRYTKVFMEVDTDRDTKITGDQARELFLSWRLPREALKQIWDLSDQDHDGMLSLREFCMALYFMERFREGHTLPSGFSAGIILDESAVATLRIAEAQAAIAQHSAGINVPTWQQNPGVLQHPGQAIPVGTVHPGSQSNIPGQLPAQIQRKISDGMSNAQLAQPKSMVPVLEENLVTQLNQDEQQTLRKKHKETEEAEKKMQELQKEIMDSNEKIEFYRTKLQEIILFKTRCDNRLTEISERAGADKREVEALAKRYDEKFKQAGDSRSRLLAEEAVFRDIQERRLEIYNALVKMDQGGDSNALLQSRGDRIYADLDELRKELNEKCKRMGLRSKPTALIELPYGWQPGLQESAVEWDDDWDKFDDEGFSIVHDLLDEGTAERVTTKSSVTSWDDGSLPEEDLDIPSGNTENKAQADILKDDPGQLEVGSSKADSEDSSIRDENENPLHEASASSPGHGRKTVAENSSATSKDSHSTEQVQASSNNSTDLFGDSAAWTSAFNANTDEGDMDVRASWGLQSSPTRTKEFSSNTSERSSFVFGDPFDMLSGSAKPHENDLHDDLHQFRPIRTHKQSSIFFDSSVPSTPLFNTSSPVQPFDERLSGHDYYSRFDSFSSNRDSGQTTARDSIARFDSFSSIGDASHARGFTSFDDSDPFAGTGPFAASRQISRNSTDTWNAFS